MKNSALRRVINNDYAFTILTKVAAVLIGLISTRYSKRFLGPALDGELSYVETLVTTVAIVANLGLYQPYPYYKRTCGPEILDKFLNLFALQFLFYAVIGVALSFIFGTFTLTAVCLIAPIQVLANQLSSAIMIEDVKYKNVIFFSARIVNTLVIILAFHTMEPTYLVNLAMIVIGDVITIVLAVRRLRRFGNPFKADLRFLRKILWFSLVAMMTTLLLTLNYNVDLMMLKWMNVEDAQRSFYRTGVSLSSFGWLISDAFREVLFSRAAKGDAIDEISLSLKVNFYLSLLMLAGVALFGRTAISIYADDRYLPAYPVTMVLLTGVLSMSYFKLIGTLLLAQGKKAVCLITLSVSAVVNVLINLYTIPRWGIMGSALASVFSYTVAGIVYLVYFVVKYQVPFASLFVIRKEEIRKLAKRIRRQPARNAQ